MSGVRYTRQPGSRAAGGATAEGDRQRSGTYNSAGQPGGRSRVLAPTGEIGVHLLPRGRLGRLSSRRAETAIRARTQTAYLGNGVSLARILGRPKIFLPTDDVGLSSHLLLDGYWEIWLTLFMSRWLRPGMSFIDAGANVGYFSLLAAQAVGPTGSVIAVEPNPALAALLRRSFALNGHSSRAKVIESALSDRPEGHMNFLVPQGDPKNGRVVGEELRGNRDVIEVPITTADAICEGLDRVDLIKIDVEGAEGEVIAGMSDVLARFKPAVILEFNALRLRDPARALDQMLAVYGSVRELRKDSTLGEITRASVLSPPDEEDLILFFGEDRGAGILPRDTADQMVRLVKPLYRWANSFRSPRSGAFH
ncbi:FkbM family methyltransferase [Enterovirga sp. CN4-39]|uniref:FkbM family methyltransferase n=1 Tax=Enterovirga sp. CN4-39 TaxID=3400910 RepID=UPI003BFBC7EB